VRFDALEDAGLAADLVIYRIGVLGTARTMQRAVNRYEVAVLFDAGHVASENACHDTENRGIRTNSECRAEKFLALRDLRRELLRGRVLEVLNAHSKDGE
jgi:hypothetical protein